MGFFSRTKARNASADEVRNFLKTSLQHGGQAIINDITFESFVEFARKNAKVMPSSLGLVKCRLDLQGSEIEATFVAGALHPQLNDNQTLIKVEEVHRNINVNDLAAATAQIMISGLKSEKITLAVLWSILAHTFMELQGFNADVFRAGYQRPDCAAEICRIADGGHEEYSEEAQNAKEENVFAFRGQLEFKVAFSLFSANLKKMPDFDSLATYSNTIVDLVFAHYVNLK